MVCAGNPPDSDSAKMKTSHGVIQGYVGVAAVDSKHQVVVSAEAFGQGQEHGFLEPMIEQIDQTFKDDEESPLKEGKILADSGFCNQETLSYLEENNIDGYIADHGFRARDPRFADVEQYRPEQAKKAAITKRFAASDFKTDIEQQTCVCPA